MAYGENMDQSKLAPTSGKYIPPHLRRQLDNAPSQPKPPKTTDKYIPPHLRRQMATASTQEKTSTSQPPRIFTTHAKVRQAQRHIASKAIEATFAQGEAMASQEAVTHIDEDTQVVLSRTGSVITVQDNKRNAAYNLLHVSQAREQQLLAEVERQNDAAMCELAEIYLNGHLGNRELQKARELLVTAAKMGNSHAMCLLARLHENGDLGTVDSAAAQAWLEKAAERNNRYALAVVGQRLLQTYLQAKKNPENAEPNQAHLQKAMRYLQAAAAKGNTRALWQLAKIEEEGWIDEKNLTKAIALYSEAASQGSYSSLHDLQRLVNAQQLEPATFEAILAKASQLIARTSSELAIDIGLEQIQGKLGTNPQRGFHLLEQAANKNNERAMKWLAKCYRMGIGCESNPQQAQYWFAQLKALYEKAVELGNVMAMLDLGHLYLKGAFGNIDLVKAEQLFLKAAEQEDIEAIYYVGMLYLRGRLGNHEPSQGIPWIEKAIHLWTERTLGGDLEAADRLVDVFLDKQLGFKDYQQAARWLSLLASKDNSQALEELLSLYLKKKIKPEGYPQIFSAEILTLIKQKAHGFEPIDALLTLARLYHEGFLPKEAESTDPWDAKSANPWAEKLKRCLHNKAWHHARAAFLLSNLYQQTAGLLPQNLKLAARWLAVASSLPAPPETHARIEHALTSLLRGKDRNDREKGQILAGLQDCAQHTAENKPCKIGRILGDVYAQGQLTPRDIQQAAHWYEKAAELENSQAMYRLGVLHQTGELGVIDVEVASQWFEQAAQHNHPLALKELVKLGKAPENTLTSANAAKPNQDTARKLLDRLYQLGMHYKLGEAGKPQDPVQAAFWLRKAAAKQHPGAAFELAQLYQASQLGEKVRPVAVSFFKQAAKARHHGAMQALITIYTEGELTSADPEQVAKWQARLSRTVG